jgi:hypothetical protein
MMQETKIAGNATVHDDNPIPTATQAASFAARQHALTRFEAIRESWRPIGWCKSRPFVSRSNKITDQSRSLHVLPVYHVGLR